MMQLRKRLSMALLILCSVSLIYFIFPYVSYQVQKLELSLLDFRFRLKPIQDPPKEIVIVEIDHFSLSQLDTWPWPRSYYGDILKVLKKHGAKVVGLDIVFDSKSSLGDHEDKEFSDGLKAFEKVVLATKRFEQHAGPYSLTSWSIPIKILRDFSDYGFVNQVSDIDGRIRKTWLFFKDDEKPARFSWDLKLFSLDKTLSLSDENIDFQKKKLRMNDQAFPFIGNGEFYINFIGEPRSFTTIPFYQVLDESYFDMSIFKDKIVLIGATDPILHDLFFTPFGLMPGVEIHANTLLTLMKGPILTDSHWLVDGLALLSITTIVGVAAFKLRALMALLVMIVCVFSHSFIVSFSFLRFSSILNWSAPLVSSIVIYLAITIVKFIKEEKEKRRIRGMFSQYVAPSIVDTLIKEPDKLTLGGEKRELTVFFSDVRAFTTFSEKYSPEQVVDILNEYLDAMTKCIFKWQGTLDKYVGDEIMAVWGAPLEIKDHAKYALYCCWDQLAVLRDLQQKWKEEGREPLDIGMGLNTGEMITGNIGSTVYKDYTVIGDPVNLAARLEGETRNYGTEEEKCYLIISEFTYEQVKDICKVKHLGSVKVKGKTKPVDIYEVKDVTMIAPPVSNKK